MREVSDRERAIVYSKITEALADVILKIPMNNSQIFWLKRAERAAYRAVYNQEPDWED